MKATGRADSPILFVMVSQPSPRMMAWFWRQLLKCGIQKSECRIVFLLDEPPAGRGNKPLKAQIRSARDRFQQDIKRSSPQVVVPLGTETFQILTGINEGIFDARGYLIRKHLFHPVLTEVWKQVGTYKNASKATGAKAGDPKMKWVKEARPTLLGDFKGVVIPSFTLEHMQGEGFTIVPAFLEDMKRIRRAVDGELVEVGKKLKIIDTFIELPATSRLGPVIAIDIETHGIDNEVIDLVSFSDGKITAVLDWDENARRQLTAIFALPDRIFALHNSPFDLPRLARNGVVISQKVYDEQIFDTMFASVNIQPDLHKALGRVASLLLDLEPWKTSSRKEASHWRIMVKKDPRGYAAKDSFYTYWIAIQEIAILKDLGAWDYFMGRGKHPGPGVMATLPVLTEMTRTGILIDKAATQKMCHHLERRLFAYLKLWRNMFPKVTFASNAKLGKLLHKTWGLPVQRNKDEGMSVDELALIKLQAYVRDNREDDMMPGPWQTDPRCVPRTFDLMLKIRDVTKTLNTYVQPVLFTEEKRVHPSYMPVSKDDEGSRGGKKLTNKGATATGRLASYKPNIQNQPKKVRYLYVPDKKNMCFIQADYKSAELFVLAWMSGDKKLLEDLLSNDMHQRNADRLGISRKVAKNVTYASQYLAGPSKQSEMILAQEHIYVSPGDCLVISDGIWGYYTKATAYKDLLIELCSNQGYIQNPFGRTRFFHSGQAPAAVDFIPQSTVADILWCVLKQCADMAKKHGGRLVTTVHDSILVSVPKNKVKTVSQEMVKIMQRPFDCVSKGAYIPVDLEVGQPGKSWAELCCTKPTPDPTKPSFCVGCKQLLTLHFSMGAA